MEKYELSIEENTTGNATKQLSSKNSTMANTTEIKKPFPTSSLPTTKPSDMESIQKESTLTDQTTVTNNIPQKYEIDQPGMTKQITQIPTATETKMQSNSNSMSSFNIKSIEKSPNDIEQIFTQETITSSNYRTTQVNHQLSSDKIQMDMRCSRDKQDGSSLISYDKKPEINPEHDSLQNANAAHQITTTTSMFHSPPVDVNLIPKSTDDADKHAQNTIPNQSKVSTTSIIPESSFNIIQNLIPSSASNNFHDNINDRISTINNNLEQSNETTLIHQTKDESKIDDNIFETDFHPYQYYSSTNIKQTLFDFIPIDIEHIDKPSTVSDLMKTYYELREQRQIQPVTIYQQTERKENASDNEYFDLNSNLPSKEYRQVFGLSDDIVNEVSNSMKSSDKRMQPTMSDNKDLIYKSTLGLVSNTELDYRYSTLLDRLDILINPFVDVSTSSSTQVQSENHMNKSTDIEKEIFHSATPYSLNITETTSLPSPIESKNISNEQEEATILEKISDVRESLQNLIENMRVGQEKNPSTEIAALSNEKVTKIQADHERQPASCLSSGFTDKHASVSTNIASGKTKTKNKKKKKHTSTKSTEIRQQREDNITSFTDTKQESCQEQYHADNDKTELSKTAVSKELVFIIT